MVPETRTTPGRQRQVGKVTATITITNRGDEVLNERGLFPPEQVRSLTIETALAGTGAMTLCLPEELVQRLRFLPMNHNKTYVLAPTPITH